MTFAYPLGLLGLIGIPILIIIYIIKNKYTEQTVSSTYIWTVSERFLKKKKKLPKLAGLISLILQMLAVTAISLIIAKPTFIFPNAAREYTFILDGSGSMGTAISDGKTRFDMAKDEIRTVIEKSENGGRYSLILISDSTTENVYTQIDDKEKAVEELEKLTVSRGKADTADALEDAQGFFNENNGALTYFVTDTDYDTHKNVEIINVAGSDENFAISSPSFTEVLENEKVKLTFAANVASYGSVRTLTVDFYINGEQTPLMTKTVSLSEKGKAETVTFEPEIEAFSSFRMTVRETDALPSDNEVIFYNPEAENEHKALLISDTPMFLKTVIEAASSTAVTVMSKDQFTDAYAGEQIGAAPAGFDLYIFDSVTPPTLPSDGAIWFFNLQGSVEGAGFYPQGEVLLTDSVELELADGSSTLEEKLTNGLSGLGLHVFKYMKYGFSSVTEIYSYQMLPMIFTLENVYENREVVFSFSLHDSNFPLLSDFVMLMKNLLDYSFPDVIEKTNYRSGEKLEINIPAGCTNIQIMTPSGTSPETLLTSAAANAFVLNEPGTYTISLTTGSSNAPTVKSYRVFAELDPTESGARSEGTSDFSLYGDAGEGGLDGIYDDLIIFIIALAVLFTADWVVYCYDKYQLR